MMENVISLILYHGENIKFISYQNKLKDLIYLQISVDI